MAQVTAKMVKELRDRTGLGMMECKKALEESNGDVEVAIDNLRKSGQASFSFVAFERFACISKYGITSGCRQRKISQGTGKSDG